jgi:ferredoxin
MIGAPSKELYTLLGTLVFQQAFDLNDPQVVEQLAFNIQWHYALNITQESDSAKYISEKTLWHWRQVLIQNGLDQLIFDKISTKLSRVFDVNTAEQRIDSVHIKSNTRKLGRIGVFSHTIVKFLVNLKRHSPEAYKSVCNELLERYGSNKAMAAFSMVKPSESTKTLQQVSADLYDFIELFKTDRAVCNMHSYKLMQRVLAEPCELATTDGDTQKVTVKPPKQIPSDSLQNPSDPDAAYSGHKGQGYQVQVMESFTRSQDEDEKEQSLNLITHVAVEKACDHDSNALMPANEDTRRRGLKPKSVVADTAYGSDDNVQAASGQNVEVIAPSYKAGKSDLGGSIYNQKGYATSCPQGHCPAHVSYKKKTNRYSARFDRDQCTSCACIDSCPVQPGKKYYYLRYSAKDHRLAGRRQHESTQAFDDIYRWRAGVEATMSQYNALTGVKRLRVRGLQAVRYCAILKAARLNMFRSAAVRMARSPSPKGQSGNKAPYYAPFSSVKERIYAFIARFGQFALPGRIAAESECRLAA